jgi:hypothetical protein
MIRTEPTTDFDSKLKELMEFVESKPYSKEEVGYVMTHCSFANDVVAKAKEQFEAKGWTIRHEFSDAGAIYDYLYLKPPPKPKKKRGKNKVKKIKSS